MEKENQKVEEVKKKKRKHRRRKKNQIEKPVQKEESNQSDHQNNIKENNTCDCEKQLEKEPEYNEYDFLKLDTLEDKAIFCKKLYKDIIECSETLDHKKIRKTMDVINKYMLYENEKDETLINLELVNILKEISNYEVKPVWQRVTSGVGIKLYVGLEYKGIVFSLCRDFE